MFKILLSVVVIAVFLDYCISAKLGNISIIERISIRSDYKKKYGSAWKNFYKYRVMIDERPIVDFVITHTK